MNPRSVSLNFGYLLKLFLATLFLSYQGRAAIYEICLVTEPLRKLIMQKKDGGELKQNAISEGMETLRQDGWRRVVKGDTTIEEVVRVTQTDEVMAETIESDS